MRRRATQRLSRVFGGGDGPFRVRQAEKRLVRLVRGDPEPHARQQRAASVLDAGVFREPRLGEPQKSERGVWFRSVVADRRRADVEARDVEHEVLLFPDVPQGHGVPDGGDRAPRGVEVGAHDGPAARLEPLGVVHVQARVHRGGQRLASVPRGLARQQRVEHARLVLVGQIQGRATLRDERSERFHRRLAGGRGHPDIHLRVQDLQRVHGVVQLEVRGVHHLSAAHHPARRTQRVVDRNPAVLVRIAPDRTPDRTRHRLRLCVPAKRPVPRKRELFHEMQRERSRLASRSRVFVCFSVSKPYARALLGYSGQNRELWASFSRCANGFHGTGERPRVPFVSRATPPNNTAPSIWCVYPSKRAKVSSRRCGTRRRRRRRPFPAQPEGSGLETYARART